MMAVLETKVDALMRQGHDTNETLRSLTRAVTQLAVVEERQTTDREAVNRAFAEIASVRKQIESVERDNDNLEREISGRISSVTTSMDGRIKALESRAPVNDLTSGFVGKVVWLVIAAVIGALVAVVVRTPASPSFTIQAPSAEKQSK